MDLLITNARYAVTSNNANEILENVSIGITDGKISYIGPDKPGAKNVYDAAGKLIAPGLINSHTHLGM
jgi:5-methylthioadenosine/S-adenosylhomocysteine deaminase